MRLASVDARSKSLDAAGAWLEKAIEKHLKAVAPRVILARLYVVTREAEKALAITRPVIDGNAANAALLKVMGQAHMAMRQPRDAAVVFRKLTTHHPKSVEAHFLLAGAYRATRNKVRYADEIRTILQLAPNNSLARLAMIRIDAEEGRIAKARERLAELKKEFPDQAPVHEMEGHVLVMEKRYDKALAAFRKMTSLLKAPNREMARLIARTQLQAGDRQGATKTLEAWIKDHPGDHDLRFTLANQYLQHGQLDAAARNYELILEGVPKNWAARNNLAWILMKRGKLERAAKHVEKALEHSKDLPEVLDTAGVIFLAQGKTDRAVKSLRKATDLQQDKRGGPNPTIQFHLAQALAESGLKEEALIVLRQILAKHAKFPERAEAQDLKTKLGG